MKTHKNSLNLKHMAFTLATVLMGFSSYASYASVNPKALESQAVVTRVHDEAVIVEAPSEINFNEWENDFNKSLRESRATETQKCRGKNCQFKNMQALDPSFEF